MTRAATEDLSINFDAWLRSRLEQQLRTFAERNGPGSAPDTTRELRIACRAVQLYAESHPRPPHVTQLQAAEILGLSRHTVSKMVKAGTFHLNRCGMIPIEQVDWVRSADAGDRLAQRRPNS